MNYQIKIAPSLLSADMARLAEAIATVVDCSKDKRAQADYIHCDVMDGHFVPNLTFGAPVVKAIKRASSLPLDVHLMIESPGSWIEDYFDAGLDGDDFLTFHLEAEPNPQAVIKKIRQKGIRPGLAIKPRTSVDAVLEWLPLIDQLLIMTVEPGFGGQSFQEEMMEKIRTVRGKIFTIPDHQNGWTGIIGVDGGIDQQTAPIAVRAGADLLVAGSAIFGQDDVCDAIRTIRLAVSKVGSE